MTPGAQVAPDQRQQPFVADFSGHPYHQYVVLDAVEKLRRVHVDAVPMTGTDVGLHLLRCTVGGASWSKAKTRLRESGVENRRENLQDGLLDQTVDHVSMRLRDQPQACCCPAACGFILGWLRLLVDLLRPRWPRYPVVGAVVPEG